LNPAAAAERYIGASTSKMRMRYRLEDPLNKCKVAREGFLPMLIQGA
jgi:hypothetical protein